MMTREYETTSKISGSSIWTKDPKRIYWATTPPGCSDCCPEVNQSKLQFINLYPWKGGEKEIKQELNNEMAFVVKKLTQKTFKRGGLQG
jgi:hypothetical protein